MPDEPLSSPRAYELYVYGLSERHPSIQRSTLVYIPSGALFGRVEGMVFFEGQVALCVQEFLNFELGVIEGCGKSWASQRPVSTAVRQQHTLVCT